MICAQSLRTAGEQMLDHVGLERMRCLNGGSPCTNPANTRPSCIWIPVDAPGSLRVHLQRAQRACPYRQTGQAMVTSCIPSCTAASSAGYPYNACDVQIAHGRETERSAISHSVTRTRPVQDSN